VKQVIDGLQNAWHKLRKRSDFWILKKKYHAKTQRRREEYNFTQRNKEYKVYKALILCFVVFAASLCETIAQ
jgi:vacuolar-type H+-ATPase catalytic subunit A/Vma1